MNDEAVRELSVAVCDVVNSFVDRASASEITGVLEIVKQIYILEALEQGDSNEDDTE